MENVRAEIISVLAANPASDQPPEQPVVVPGVQKTEPVPVPSSVTWQLNDNVPGTPGLIIRRMVLVNGNVEVFALPQDGSAMDNMFIQNSGKRHGIRFTLLSSSIKVIAASAPIDVFTELLNEALLNSDDNYDEEEEEEEEEEEISTAPTDQPPPPPVPQASPGTFQDNPTQISIVQQPVMNGQE